MDNENKILTLGSISPITEKIKDISNTLDTPTYKLWVNSTEKIYAGTSYGTTDNFNQINPIYYQLIKYEAGKPSIPDVIPSGYKIVLSADYWTSRIKSNGDVDDWGDTWTIEQEEGYKNTLQQYIDTDTIRNEEGSRYILEKIELFKDDTVIETITFTSRYLPKLKAGSNITIDDDGISTTILTSTTSVYSTTPNNELYDYGTDTALWDFQNVNPESLSGLSIEGTIGTVASNISLASLSVDATNGKVSQRDSDVQINEGTIVKIPVYRVGDTLTITSYPSYYNFTLNGTAADADIIMYTATEGDVTKGYVELIATATAYLYSIKLVSTIFTADWTTYIPNNTSENPYIWRKDTYHYSDNTTTTTEPILIQIVENDTETNLTEYHLVSNTQVVNYDYYGEQETGVNLQIATTANGLTTLSKEVPEGYEVIITRNVYDSVLEDWEEKETTITGGNNLPDEYTKFNLLTNYIQTVVFKNENGTHNEEITFDNVRAKYKTYNAGKGISITSDDTDEHVNIISSSVEAIKNVTMTDSVVVSELPSEKFTLTVTEGSAWLDLNIGDFVTYTAEINPGLPDNPSNESVANAKYVYFNAEPDGSFYKSIANYPEESEETLLVNYSGEGWYYIENDTYVKLTLESKEYEGQVINKVENDLNTSITIVNKIESNSSISYTAGDGIAIEDNVISRTAPKTITLTEDLRVSDIGITMNAPCMVATNLNPLLVNANIGDCIIAPHVLWTAYQSVESFRGYVIHKISGDAGGVFDILPEWALTFEDYTKKIITDVFES